MPSSPARSFILATKASSLPETASASTTAASLALMITVALSRSSTVICSPSSSQMSDPPMEAAWAEAVSSWSRESSPASRASKVSSNVITLVMEAQARRSWAPFSNSTCPVEASISTAAGAVTATWAPWAETPGRARTAPSANARAFLPIRLIGTLLSMLLEKHMRGKGALRQRDRPPARHSPFARRTISPAAAQQRPAQKNSAQASRPSALSQLFFSNTPHRAKARPASVQKAIHSPHTARAAFLTRKYAPGCTSRSVFQ